MDYKLATLLMAVFLLVGLGLGAVAFPVEKIETKIVENTVTETVEVPVEVEVVKYIDYLSESVDLFLAELSEDDDLLTCDGHEYDLADVKLSKVYDSYSVSFDDEERTVDFSVKLKYKEADRESCRSIWNVSVFYEEDESPEVSY